MSTKEEINHLMKTEFPQARLEILEVGNGGCIVKKKIEHQHLRPGGTVSGPTMMAVADAALYVAILGEVGMIPMAVTTNLNINFLRKPSPDKDIIAVCKLIKVGKVLVVGEVSVYPEGQDEPVAHVVGTYSIPPIQQETTES